jgi:hypothetical protein
VSGDHPKGMGKLHLAGVEPATFGSVDRRHANSRRFTKIDEDAKNP